MPTASTIARTAASWLGGFVFLALMLYAPGTARPTGGVALVLLAVVAVGLLTGLLRRWPVVGVAFTLAGALALGVAGHATGPAYAQLLVCAAITGGTAALRPLRVSAPAALLTLLVGVAAIFVIGSAHETVSMASLVGLATVAAWTIGRSVRERREHAETSRARATTQAVTAERLRIARELHDQVAHSIGIIAVQAGVGARVIDTQPVAAREALSVIEATSRETLAGLRRTLVSLRGPDEPAAAPLAPAPGLDDIDRLIERTKALGVRVTVEHRGERPALPAEIDLAAYRIVQEAVANVVRHAGTDACAVVLDHGIDALTVTVTDAGRGGRPAGTGYGLLGMRERAELLGGRLSAGPGPDGGFRVEAVLPLAAVVP